MTTNEFNMNIIGAITASCKIPFKIPVDEIKRIARWSAEWFYRNAEIATDNVYIVIKSEDYLNSDEYKKSRGIILPSCVYTVHGVTKNNQFRNYNATSDFSLDKYIYNSYGLGGSTSSDDGIYSDAVLTFVVQANWDDLLHHITKYPLSYNYNPLNNRFFIKGDVKDCPDLILDVDIKLPLEYLYNSDQFYNYVLGQSYMQLSNILGAIDVNLPGDAKIDYDRWFSQGERLIQMVEDEINADNTPAFFYTTNGR